MTYMPQEPTDFQYYPVEPKEATTMGARYTNIATSKYEYIMRQEFKSGETRPLKFNIAAPCLAMAWNGMEPGKNAIKVTIHRTFNMIPQKETKDLL